MTTLHLLTLSLHFVAMNFLLGGVILVAQAAVRGRGDDPTLVRFTRLFPTIMAATVTLGVAPLLFLQLVYPRQAYAAAIVSGWFWLMVVAAVLIAYSALYLCAGKSEKSGRVNLPLLLLALVGMMYVSITYGSIFAMAERPDLIRALYTQDQSGLVWNPATGDYLLRWLHMVVGAVTVGGFCVGMLGRNATETYRVGKSFFVVGMALAFMLGLAYLLSLLPILAAFMHTPAIWGLTAAILLSLGSLHFFFKKNFPVSGAMLFVSLVGMVYARHTVRLLKLAGQFDPASWRIAPQWGPFVLFVVCFVMALAVVAYMLRLFFTATERSA
ncbi:MAG: hypothetical protein ACHQ9S_25605 [Candidatus Binatia bacterium]